MTRLVRPNAAFILGFLLSASLIAFTPAILRGQDCNSNGIPDNCDIDCGQTGGPCDVPGCGGSEDCNSNGIPDECDLVSMDCNLNGVVDACEQAWASMTWTVDPTTPVLGPDGHGSVSYAAVVMFEDGVYKAWYNNGDYPGSIMYTTSPNGINNWQPSILVYTPLNEMPQLRLAKRGGAYYMWMGGCTQGLELATSPDGQSWTYQGTSQGIGDSQAMLVDTDNNFRAWYSACSGPVCYRTAKSSDGLQWEDEGCVFPRGAPGQFDYYLGTLGVVHIGSTYHMWYACGPGFGPNSLGYATSPDGVTWQKHGPVSGSINDYQNVSYPCVLLIGDTLEMWFHKENSARVYRATSLFGNDCNNNEVFDSCDIADCDPNDPDQRWCRDCNSNGIPDGCEGGFGLDCDDNGTPDVCEWADCNNNGVLDKCDIAAGSSDCVDDTGHSGTPDGIPDDCQTQPYEDPIHSGGVGGTTCGDGSHWCWDTPGNWCPPLVPDNNASHDYEVFLANPALAVTLDISPTLTGLSITGGATLEVNSNSFGDRTIRSDSEICNAGFIKALNGRTLELAASNINQAETPPGRLEAIGVGSVIEINGETVTGGFVCGTDGGQIKLLGGALLYDVTIDCGRGDSSVVVSGGQYGQVAATINNHGSIAVGAGSIDPAFLFTGGTGALLAGEGRMTLGSTNALLWILAEAPLTNGPDHTIEGFGQIFGSLLNQGTIAANVAQQTLNLGYGGDITNNGKLQATNGGILRIREAVLGTGTLLAVGGTIIISSNDEGPVTVDEDGPVIVDPGSAGLIEVQGGKLLGASYWQIGNDEIGPDKTATLKLLNNATGVVKGPVHVHQNGTLRITSSSLTATDLILDDGAKLFVSSSVTLSGSLASGMTDGGVTSWSWATGSDLLMTGGAGASNAPCSLEGWSTLEAASADVGPAGGNGDFKLADLIIATGARVSLVDHRRNHLPPVVAEAVYCDSLTLGAGAVLNLNRLHLYVQGALVNVGPYGAGMIQDEPRALWHGDFDGNGIGISDVPLFVSALLEPNPWTTCTGDVNQDGLLDGRDIQFFLEWLLQGGLPDIPTFVAVLLGLDTDPMHIFASDLDESGTVDGRDVQPFVDRLLAP